MAKHEFIARAPSTGRGFYLISFSLMKTGFRIIIL